jgi:hypothetical protein
MVGNQIDVRLAALRQRYSLSGTLHALGDLGQIIRIIIKIRALFGACSVAPWR